MARIGRLGATAFSLARDSDAVHRRGSRAREPEHTAPKINRRRGQFTCGESHELDRGPGVEPPSPGCSTPITPTASSTSWLISGESAVGGPSIIVKWRPRPLAFDDPALVASTPWRPRLSEVPVRSPMAAALPTRDYDFAVVLVIKPTCWAHRALSPRSARIVAQGRIGPSVATPPRGGCNTHFSGGMIAPFIHIAGISLC